MQHEMEGDIPSEVSSSVQFIFLICYFRRSLSMTLHDPSLPAALAFVQKTSQDSKIAKHTHRLNQKCVK